MSQASTIRLPLVLAIMVAIATVFLWNGNVRADTAPTGATVGATGGISPNIECKWELPDMDSSTPGIQYGNDDRPSTFPSVNPACALPTAPGTTPTMPDNVHNMIQVAVNPEDLPEERRVQLWMGVDHPNGISNINDVYWKVYHPDGTFKIQVHGTAIVGGATGECETLGTGGGAASTMFGSATATGQISAAAVNDINRGIITKCKQNEKRLYYAEFSISKHQPCGEYKIEAHAVSTGAPEDVLTNYIDVLCVFYGRIDFNSVNWGTITPGLTDIVSGDFLFQPPSSTAPTIKNLGNSGMGVSIHFSKMLQQGVSGPKEIDQFDACFARLRVRGAYTAADGSAVPAEDGNYSLRCFDPIFASTTLSFDGPPVAQDTGTPPPTTNQVLCPNEVGKLDLSIHPPSTLPPGTYAGTVDITFHANPICPTDLGHVHPTPIGT